MNKRVKRDPKLWEALIPVILTIGVLMYTVIPAFGVEGEVHIPLIFGALISAVMAVFVWGFKWKEIEEGILSSIAGTMQAIIILAIIGMIVGTWILSGVVPVMIYYGLQILNPAIFLVASCLLCSVISLATGSSWTTAGTVGIALMGVAAGLGIPAPMAAGAIISGAYFGDKMSPLSDTTNLAPAMAGANLFDHVRHMFYTTGVSLVIALIGFGVLSAQFAGQAIDMTAINGILTLMRDNFNLSPFLLLVPVLVILMVARKVPAIPGLFMGTVLGGIAAMLFQGASLPTVMDVMQNGFSMESGNAVLDDLLSRGGLQGMMWTISLILCALTFGGILEKTRVLEVIAGSILRYAKSTGSLVFATVFTSIFTNVLAGDQYLSIVLPGKMYKDEFERRGLAPRNLSRCLEDAGTLTSPLVPWNTCGVTMSTNLGVPTIEYLPYCFLNLVNPIVSIVYGYTGITMMKVQDDPSHAKYVKKATA